VDTLTIFYNTRTGTIKEICGGSQSMSWFGDESEDYAQIFSYLIVPYDEYILANFKNMNVVSGKLTVKEATIPAAYSSNEGVI